VLGDSIVVAGSWLSVKDTFKSVRKKEGMDSWKLETLLQKLIT
jgi:hypothetical protein